MKDLKGMFNIYLDTYIQSFYEKDDPLGKVIIYVLEGKGKRVRPQLCMLSYLACGGKIVEKTLPACLAIEMVHIYSLVHDDLPSMDNDDLRRGRPTAHTVFSEGLAVLAGDALLADAFSLLSGSNLPNYSSGQKVHLINVLSSLAGSLGMARGQGLDLFYTSNPIGDDESIIHSLHILKTGSLMGAACAMGGICAKASKDDVDKLQKFGALVGLAFQIIDDLLDNEKTLGKSSGKDISQNKPTFLSIMEKSEAEKVAVKYTEQAIKMLDSFKKKGEPLKDFVNDLLTRKK